MGFNVSGLRRFLHQMPTVYFLLFIISMSVSIILVNSGEKVFKMYTSCHGDEVFDITWIGVLILLQCLLSLPSLDRHGNEEYSKSTTSVILEDESDMSNKIGYTADSSNITIRYASELQDQPTATASINSGAQGSYSEKHYKTSVSKIKDNRVGSISQEDTCGYIDGVSESVLRGQNKKEEQEQKSSGTKCSALNNWFNARFGICWNSLWMLFYNLIIFLGIHSSLLASRIHGNIDLNKYALETCSHLSVFQFSLMSPTLKFPLISESVFMITYLSFAVHELVVRKAENSFLIKNFIGRHYFKESMLLGSIRLIVQVGIFSGNIFLICFCITCGYGSPMHVLVGFSLSMLVLWVNSHLSQILQLTHLRDMRSATLDFNWLWSIMSAFVLWLCGFLFYASVYGIPYYSLYLYIHPVAWILFLSLTFYKGSQIFAWRNIPQGWVPTFS
ncbi:hypothetical protein BEWA_028030 [Theileria equi strain WA]|uniref:Uncharacterized protein n=1 Tax=Theileria equi strain WA TaxID=1537102 RepID=L0AYJ9_THEEQ|nr:hypothetical protein BEWA_028030 [Theileria equi strain WA]AFZ79954.1 hypothetical protein BEWA_028030 [Theileria equi strain WA]|eukprot:XP_004829620.1 hypothetical protein BEWA_028030 [Theileria equi strain WA]